MAGEEFRFVPGTSPCDICQGMLGVYPYAPSVPVHPNCDCRVERVSQDDNCGNEIRNARSQINTSTETMTLQLTVQDALPEDVEQELHIPLGIQQETWDDPLLKEALDWSPPEGYQVLHVTLGAGPPRSVNIQVELDVEEILGVGELWEVCRRAPVPGSPLGFAHTISERLIGTVGGGGIARKGIAGASTDETPAPEPGGSPYYEDDEEVPT